MASKAEKNTAPKAKKTAAKKAVVNKPKAAMTKTETKTVAEAAKPAAEKNIITNIVEAPAKVEAALQSSEVSSTIKNGVEKMTKTTEKATDAAKTFFADMQVKANEAAEKGRKLATDAYAFQKANVEAMIASGKIAAEGAQELGKTNFEFAKENFGAVQAAVKELTAVKSPNEFVKVQAELARKGFDTAVSQASKNSETVIKLASDIFQPISNRMAVATDFFKKAA
ncbi:hypothetical protein LPB140_04125 [Sphingorhabdus lutea]|uniref:Phasin domain-containing protein n=1 Tax=Sphingorhabdus lutea TaxID=1913578 RepID=A0A1L3JET0_9SPHN|nr:phasin family protein [Sphingorhabdus lutea]APG63563.1 hypothetical protein LPB140_04125 [Sphingorhabdus lutea]